MPQNPPRTAAGGKIPSQGDTMLGQMMQQPLLISSLIVHAERHHPEREVVSRRVARRIGGRDA